MSQPVLVISPEDRTPPAFKGTVRHLRFRFADSAISGPFSASYDAQHKRFNLLEACRAIQGEFLEQGLNRHVAQLMLEVRPSAVYILGLYGCTWDLLRLCHWLNISCYLQLGQEDLTRLTALDDQTRTLIEKVLQKVTAVVLEPELEPGVLGSYAAHITQTITYEHLSTAAITPAEKTAGNARSFDYALYEILQRDHTLLYRQQEHRAPLFDGCEKVLDLGCGVGIFLSALRARGITAEGVERNAALVEYARDMAFTVHQSDALEFLQNTHAQYDGIYCSHFVEHLPFEVVETLIQSAASALRPGGVLVLTFPDPESIRSQLLGFWRDPEHVRFYHPELINTLSRAAGFHCEWSSYDDQPHEVIPFPVTMPELPLPDHRSPSPATQPGFWQRCLAKLGLVTSASHESHLQNIQQRLDSQEQFNRALAERIQTLWTVNATWGWNDDVTLKLRKHKEHD